VLYKYGEFYVFGGDFKWQMLMLHEQILMV